MTAAREAAGPRTGKSRALAFALLAVAATGDAIAAQGDLAVPILDEIRIPLQKVPAPPASVHSSSPASPAAGATTELARCRVLVWITADGSIRAAQVVGSSGAERLDAACLHGLIGRHVEPSWAEGHPVDTWAIVPLVWVGSGSRGPIGRAAPPAIPALASTQALHLKPPYYPTGALERHEQGDCTVHVSVSAQGHLQDLRITRSSGSADLDAGCLAALYAARFTPARHGTQAVDAATDVVLHWQLPP